MRVRDLGLPPQLPEPGPYQVTLEILGSCCNRRLGWAVWLGAGVAGANLWLLLCPFFFSPQQWCGGQGRGPVPMPLAEEVLQIRGKAHCLGLPMVSVWVTVHIIRLCW